MRGIKEGEDGFKVRSSDLETGLSSNASTVGIDTETAAFIPTSSHPSVSPLSRPFHALKEKCSLNEEILGRFRERF